MYLVEDRTRLNIPKGTAPLLANLIHEYAGLYFDEEHTDGMLDKLAALAIARGYNSFLDYYHFLKYEGEKAREWEKVIEALSVQETYFWREMDQVRALVDELVPKWFARTEQPLQIWSAACATGEEPFTIAMALQEAGWFRRAPIQIVGSDLCASGLEKARRGLFRERSFRCLPPELRQKHFTSVPQGFAIAPELLVRVRFQRANLVAPAEITPLAHSPVIFCRNVFIYFSANSIRRTVRSFAENMPANAHLFIGTCESLLNITGDFALQEIGDAFVYRKKS